MASAEEVQTVRNTQFAQFAASVEVGLQDYLDPEGPRRLIKSLVRRYCDIEPESPAQERESKEARRQICLLFGLMEENQPVQQLSKQLAAIDNGVISTVVVKDGGSGYAPGYGSPLVEFPDPDAEGDVYVKAKGRAVLAATGKLLRIDVVDRGAEYVKGPNVRIAPPAALRFGVNETYAEAATAKAFIFRSGPNKGKIERIQLTSPGEGYSEREIIRVYISPPEQRKFGVTATATAIREYAGASF